MFPGRVPSMSREDCRREEEVSAVSCRVFSSALVPDLGSLKSTLSSITTVTTLFQIHGPLTCVRNSEPPSPPDSFSLHLSSKLVGHLFLKHPLNLMNLPFQ